jgi:uncharacterized protein YodC (DUF2158 family)
MGHAITTFGVVGEPYASYTDTYDADWQLTGEIFFNADGSVHNSDTIAYNSGGSTTTSWFDGSGALTSRETDSSTSHALTTFGVTGEPYASYTDTYDAGWNLTGETFFNADGSVYQSDTIAYNADGSTTTDWFDGSGALTSRETDSATGHAISTFGVTGEPYASYTDTFDAGWNLTSQTYFKADGSVYQP